MKVCSEGASTFRALPQPIVYLLFNKFGNGVGGSWIHEVRGKSKEKRMRNKIVENHILPSSWDHYFFSWAGFLLSWDGFLLSGTAFCLAGTLNRLFAQLNRLSEGSA